MLKVAVTGGSGQLGSLVLKRLIEDRRVKSVVSIDLRPPLRTSGKLTAVQADIRESGFERYLTGCDVLVHLAFVVTQHLPRALVNDINVAGSKNVFCAARAAGVRQIIYASSVAAYGVVTGHPNPIVEDTPRRYQPDFAYAATKFEVEAFLDAFEKESPDIAVVRFRPAILVGTRMDHPLGRAFRRRIIPAISNAPLPLVWDEDVADAILLAIQKGARGAFNLSADEPMTPRALAQATGMRALNVPSGVALTLAALSTPLSKIGLGQASDPAWIKGAQVPLVFSSERARRELGWSPKYSTAVAVMKRFTDIVPNRLDPKIRHFFRLLKFASAARATRAHEHELAGIKADVHLCLTGPHGGDFGLQIHESRLKVSFQPPRPAGGTITLPAALFLELITGRADFSSAQFTGKIRVEGDAFAAMLLGGLISGFRTEAAQPGLRHLPARLSMQWFERKRS